MKKSLSFLLYFSLILSESLAQVTITEPNKPQYYFSDGHPPSYYDGNAHSPVIFTNTPHYDPVNDIVWLKNDKIKIGINLKRGGQLAWASLANATTNLVYNGYDGGFQVTLDAYEKKDGYTQNGKVSHSAPNNGGSITSYNVTQGGDFSNHAVSLIDYHAIPNGYYVKLRPIFYTLDSELSQTFIETKYTIIGNSVKIEYKYTSFRTDGQWDGGGFDGAGAPACFIVNTLNKYKTYTGNNPWTNAPTVGGDLPNTTNAGVSPADAHATEYWGMVYDANHPESGIGVYNADNGGSSAYFVFKQLEVYPQNGPGTEFLGGFTFFQPFINFNITNRSSYVKDIVCYLIVGSETEIRNRAVEIHQGGPNCPIVPNPPTGVSANPTTVASGGQSILSATCATGNVVWGNGSSTVNPTVTTTYNAKCVAGTCESTPISVTVTVPVPPSGNHCPYQDAQGWHYWSQAENKFKDGNWFAWDAPNSRILFALKNSQGVMYASSSPNPGGDVLTSNQLLNAGVPQDIINCFFGCTTVPNPPTGVSANPTSVSSGGQSILSATCATGSVVWGNGSSTVNPTVTTTYTAKCIAGSCESTSISVTVTVIPPSGNHCPYQDAQGWHYWSQAENKFKDGNWFAWDAPNSRILFALNGSSGLYASLNANPGGGALTRQQLRNAGVPEDIVLCFSDGQARIGVNSEEKTNAITAYPNPTNGKVRVEFFLEKAENVWFNLYSLQGRSMELKNVEGKEGDNSVELDIKHYPAGTYFINLQSSQKPEVVKIIKIE